MTVTHVLKNTKYTSIYNKGKNLFKGVPQLSFNNNNKKKEIFISKKQMLLFQEFHPKISQTFAMNYFMMIYDFISLLFYRFYFFIVFNNLLRLYNFFFALPDVFIYTIIAHTEKIQSH